MIGAAFYNVLALKSFKLTQLKSNCYKSFMFGSCSVCFTPTSFFLTLISVVVIFNLTRHFIKAHFPIILIGTTSSCQLIWSVKVPDNVFPHSGQED